MKRLIMMLTVVSLAGFMAVACGKKSEGGGETAKPAAAAGPVGACNYTKDGYCNEYFGSMVTKNWIDENNCKPLKVSVIDKCPTEGAAARCIFDEGTPQMRQMVIYKKALVKAYCEMAGGKEIPL